MCFRKELSLTSEIKKGMNMIPVVFSVDDNYAEYLYVVISSLIEHASTTNRYKIFVFYTSLTSFNIELLESLSNYFVSIECVNIVSYVGKTEIKGCNHISVETCYRLYIPDVLSQYKKVLYLDTDIIVLGDVAELFKIDLGNYAVGFVHDVECTYLKDHCNELGFDFNSMFNAGVMLINTEQFKNQNIKENCLEILIEDSKKSNRKMVFMDQDALMSVVGNNYKVLDDCWNFQFQYLWRKESVYDDYLPRYEDNSEKCCILHYAGNRKPWYYPELPKADIFWKYASKTSIFNSILNKCVLHYRDICDKYVNSFKFKFPFSNIVRGSRIAVYAAGMAGKDIVTQMEVTQYAEVTLWVDKNCRYIEDRRIDCPDELYKQQDMFDYIVIAINDERIAREVKEEIIEKGIDERKVVLLEW